MFNENNTFHNIKTSLLYFCLTRGYLMPPDEYLFHLETYYPKQRGQITKTRQGDYVICFISCLLRLQSVIYSLSDISTYHIEAETNGTPFSDDIFKCIFLNRNFWISNEISMKCVPNGLNDNMQHWFRSRLGTERIYSSPSLNHFISCRIEYYKFANLDINIKVDSDACKRTVKYRGKGKMPKLAHYVQVTLYGDTDLAQRYFRQWLVARRHQAITWKMLIYHLVIISVVLWH